MKIAAVVVTYNRKILLGSCLQAIEIRLESQIIYF